MGHFRVNYPIFNISEQCCRDMVCSRYRACISRYNIYRDILYRDIVSILIDQLFLNKPLDDGATQSEDDSDATQSEDTEIDRT